MKKTTALLTAGMLLVLSLTGCGVPANTVFKAEDLEGKTIGAQLGTTGYTFAETEVKDAKVEPYNKGADAVLAAVESGKADVGVAGLSVTPDREKSVSFTQGYATSKQVIIVRKD